MDYEPNRPSGSSGGLIVGLLLLLLLGGIGIVGLGTYIWLSRQSEARQAAAMERAALEAQAAAAAAARHARLALEQRAPVSPRPALPSVDLVDIGTSDGAQIDASITIDGEGTIAFQGRALTRDELVTTLRGLAAQEGENIVVTIWADEARAFRDVAGVVRAARTAGVKSLKIVVPESRVTAEPLEQD